MPPKQSASPVNRTTAAVRRKASLIRLPFWAAAFVVLVCVAILGLSASREWGSRARELKNAEIDMANLARSLTQHADDSFDLLDASILGIVGRLETEGTGAVTISKLEKILQMRKAGLTRIRGLFIYDENGAWLATSENLNLAGLNNSDRDYFQHHKQSAVLEAWIGPPIKSRSNGEWVINVSRRFNHPDGRFAGVVAASIGADYFSHFYRQFDIGENGAIALLNANGIVLARSPDDSTYVGRDLSNSPLFRDLNERPANGVYYFKSRLDGSPRLSFYKRSDRWPLVVLAISDQDEILAPWHRAATIRIIFVLSLISLIATIGFFLVRQLQQRQRLTSALVAKEADFRLLAEESSDMVTRIGLDERLLYVSPSSVGIVGWNPEQLTGTPALAGVNADDLPRVKQTVAALRRGEVADARIVYRSRHRAAKEIWIESTMRVTRSQGTGRIDGVVAVSRDVTQQKKAEEKLAALAVLDGLTGLANRRCFDERLQDEWARAQREGSPLSLLMIDVDHFKKFNDQYGHPAGDTCLQAVAKALATEAGRPADLAARYGGEEFVLLLPATDEDGARMVGERLRAEIRKLAIAHASNPPSLLVTVSLGGATVRRTADESMESASLIQAADQALYVAKDDGRDRLVMSSSETPGSKIAPSDLVEH